MSSNRYKWLLVALLWFVCLFNYADRQAIFSVFDLLKAEMRLTDVQLGVIGGIFGFLYAIWLPLAGLIADRFNRKHLILGGLFFWSFITLATALSTRYWHLVFFRAIEGLGEAFYFPASISLISDYHARATRSRAMGIHQSSVYAGTILGGWLAGKFAEHYGWRSGFYIFGSAGILLGFVLLFMVKEAPRGQAERETDGLLQMGDGQSAIGNHRWDVGAALKHIFSLPIVPVLMCVFMGANFVAAIFLSWMPTFLKRKFDLSYSMAGLNATAWLQIASMIGVLFGGWLADRLIRRTHGGRLITQIIGLIAGVPFIFIIGWTPSIHVLILGMIGFGFCKGLYDANTWASLYDVVRPERRGTAMSLMNSVGWFAGAFAPVALAAASNRYGMSAGVSAASAIYLVCGIILLVAIRRMTLLAHFAEPSGTPVQPGVPVFSGQYK